MGRGRNGLFNLSAGRYRYSEDLKALDRCRSAAPVRLPHSLDCIVTPLSWRGWQVNLAHHPDRAFANWLVGGICDGFRIGFNYMYTRSRPRSHRNLASAFEKPQVIHEYLARECAEGRIMGLFLSDGAASVAY